MADIENEELQYEECADFETKDKTTGDESTDQTMANGTEESIESELEAIKARVKEMEEEAEKIKQIQSEVDQQVMGSPPGGAGAASKTMLSLEDKMEIDTRSIFVGNVDYLSTAEELERHFHGCGAVNRVTILCNKYDGHPKGFAYVEFSDKDSVFLAMSLDDSLFRGRQLKVMPKRTNKPGVSTTNRRPRGMRSRRPFPSFPMSSGSRRGGGSRFRGRKYFGPY